MKTKGLTIQEAIKSGMPFKRPNKTRYHLNNDCCAYTTEEVLANDWELQVPEVTITREKLAEAWQRRIAGHYISNVSPDESMTFDPFAKEFGL